MTYPRRTLRATGAAALLSVLVLAGCSDEEPLPELTTPAPTTQEPTDDEDATTTAPGDDEEATTAPGDDEAATTQAPEEDEGITQTSENGRFTVTLPSGWEDAYELAAQEGVLLAAKEVERKDEFFSNVVVTEEDYVGNLTSAVEQAAEELAGEDGEYELLEPAPVDGNRAPGYTLVRDVQGSTIHQTQRWISNQGILYVVTFSAIESQAEEAAEILNEVLASWTWQDPPLEPPTRAPRPDHQPTGSEPGSKAQTFGSGTQLVGSDISPGTYRTPNANDSCYWERLSGTSGELRHIIANDNPEGPAVVTISSTDVAFNSSRCGTWSRIGD